jgi:hypothetical protein
MPLFDYELRFLYHLGEQAHICSQGDFSWVNDSVAEIHGLVVSER